MSKVTKVLSQEVAQGSLIAAHVQTTDGQRVIVYDYNELTKFLCLLTVPFGVGEAGMHRFLKNTYADVAARVFLNWLADGQPSDVAEYWTNERANAIAEEAAAALPPGVEPGSFNHSLYNSWMAEQYDRLPYHQENWVRL